jgi:NADPH:quinone reductase-like Zn-dependent oxidoreductase
MKAAVVHETGDPDVLQLEDVPTPEPADGQVLIRVRAAAVNPIDWKYRRGLAPRELPAILGSDVSGTIELSRADGFAEGDDVFGFTSSGAYAEYAISSPQASVKKPAAVSHEQAAAIPVAGLTAWQALFDRAGLERGQTALIVGAAGGVGHFGVQFAKLAGARVIGTGSTHNRELVLGLGADEYVDYTQQDVSEAVSGVDVVFDTVGGQGIESLLPVLREGGILVTIAGAPPEAAARERGVRAELLSMSASMDQLARIGDLVAEGTVRVEIVDLLPLAEIRRAHELSESGHARGKIVLTLA